MAVAAVRSRWQSTVSSDRGEREKRITRRLMRGGKEVEDEIVVERLALLGGQIAKSKKDARLSE